MSDRYDEVRRDEHSTLGDVTERYRRDSDAFAAGSQYVLDRLTGLAVLGGAPLPPDYLVGWSATLLDDVHHGRL